MDYDVKNEQLVYLSDDIDESFNSNLLLQISSTATNQEDNSFHNNSSFDCFTTDNLISSSNSSSKSNSTSSTSSTSSFFISSNSSTGLNYCPNSNEISNNSLIFFNANPNLIQQPLSFSPTRSASSTSSSLSLSIDTANFFLINNHSTCQPNHNQQHQRGLNYSANNLNRQDYFFDNFDLLSSSHQYQHEQLNVNNHRSIMKQDVSVGTDVIINREMRTTKDWMDNIKYSNFNQIGSKFMNSSFVYEQNKNNMSLNQLNTIGSVGLVKINNEKESFKLIEKIQPKKSRTKYSKEQIEMLENAYWRNAYPDLITVEHLCKSLGIPKEKINIWFQNRRARNKRNGL